ncbi:MAG: zinc ribbon domain-containing protein [Acidobacteriaceae bacterium]|nr:zinc ribbon domain-containing protein [Acidobacteriaceae bacterium]
MPLYEYQCEKCGDLFEAMQKFSDEPLTVHDKCGGPVHRLLSAPALQFKGSGWYITDYARANKAGSNGSPGKSETAESKPASGESSTASSSSDTKPASSSTSTEKK